jgi:hypothetical protein
VDDDRRASSARTSGATSVPSSSIEHHLAVRDGAGRRLHEESLVPEHLLLEGDLLGDLLGAADDE